MKKIFKSMAILAATAAVGTGVGLATGCSAGTNGKYVGSYSYTNAYGATYGMMVEVTVENNIITKVEDVTPEGWVVVSDAMPEYGWSDSSVQNWKDNEAWLLQQYEGWEVSKVLEIKVFIKTTGEPYELKNANNVATNAQLEASKLLIGGATQGSGRLLLAVQNALSK